MSSIIVRSADTNQCSQNVYVEHRSRPSLTRKAILSPAQEFNMLLQDIASEFKRPLSNQELIIQDNLQSREIEPEDVLLVTSGALARLIAEAKEEPPSDDWERDLDEL